MAHGGGKVKKLMCGMEGKMLRLMAACLIHLGVKVGEGVLVGVGVRIAVGVRVGVEVVLGVGVGVGEQSLRDT